MKTIPLTQGLVVKVDDEDYDRLAKHKWYAARYGGLVYAQREIRTGDTRNTRKTIQLHRLILLPKPGFITDHEDGDGLNCQKYNLRYATYLQNGSNKKTPNRKRKKSSLFKGVSWAPDREKWRAMIRVNWKLKQLGGFDSEEAAARAYDAAAKEYFGEFACLNYK